MAHITAQTETQTPHEGANTIDTIASMEASDAVPGAEQPEQKKVREPQQPQPAETRSLRDLMGDNARLSVSVTLHQMVQASDGSRKAMLGLLSNIVGIICDKISSLYRVPAKRLMALRCILMHWGTHSDRVWPGVDEIALQTGLSKSTVKRALSLLRMIIGIEAVVIGKRLADGPGPHKYEYERRSRRQVKTYDLGILSTLLPPEMHTLFRNAFPVPIPVAPGHKSTTRATAGAVGSDTCGASVRGGAEAKSNPFATGVGAEQNLTLSVPGGLATGIADGFEYDPLFDSDPFADDFAGTLPSPQENLSTPSTAENPSAKPSDLAEPSSLSKVDGYKYRKQEGPEGNKTPSSAAVLYSSKMGSGAATASFLGPNLTRNEGTEEGSAGLNFAPPAKPKKKRRTFNSALELSGFRAMLALKFFPNLAHRIVTSMTPFEEEWAEKLFWYVQWVRDDKGGAIRYKRKYALETWEGWKAWPKWLNDRWEAEKHKLDRTYPLPPEIEAEITDLSEAPLTLAGQVSVPTTPKRLPEKPVAPPTTPLVFEQLDNLLAELPAAVREEIVHSAINTVVDRFTKTGGGSQVQKVQSLRMRVPAVRIAAFVLVQAHHNEHNQKNGDRQ
jgi:hypothetical protein